jgi:putative ABC transport system permease protein
MALALLCGARLVPVALRPAAAAADWLLSRVARPTTRIGVLHLVRERSRSAAICALVTVVVAMTLVTGAAYTSVSRSLDEQIAAQFGHDLELSSASGFPPDVVGAVGDVPGVGAVTGVGIATTVLHSGEDETVEVRAVDPEGYFAVSGLKLVDGDVSAVQRGLEDTAPVVLPVATADRLDVGVGDEIDLVTAQGDRAFRVVGTAEIGSLNTTLLTSAAAGERFLAIRAPQDLLVALAPGADREATAAAIEAGLRGRATFLVSTIDDERADARAQLGGAINGFFVLLLLAGAMGVLGLANTMVVATLQRLRELAVIRALGARPSHVRSMVLAEASVLVAIALVLGVAMGALVARPVLAELVNQLGDLTVHYHFPWTILPVIAVAAVVAANLTAALPIRSANTADLEQAMRVE